MSNIDKSERRPKPKVVVSSAPKGLSKRQIEELRVLKEEFGDKLFYPILEAFYFVCECKLASTKSTISGYLEEYAELSERYIDHVTITSETVEMGAGSDSIMSNSRNNATSLSSDLDDGLKGATMVSALDSDYSVSVSSQQLGLTIENVFERTVVRSVLEGSEAKKKGVKNNSLVISVGITNCLTQTHAETLDTLKRSTRPVKISFRLLDGSLLNQRRAEMQGFLQKKRDQSATLDSNYYDATIKQIEQRTKWLLRMFAVALCLPECMTTATATSTSASTATSTSTSTSCSPVAGASTFDNNGAARTVDSDANESPEARRKICMRGKSEADKYFIEKKVEPTLELLLGMEKQCYMNNRANVLPFMRLTTTLDYLAIFYCELDDSVHTPPHVLTVLESDITDICFSLLQLEANAIPGNENPAESALPNESPHNLLHLIISRFGYEKLKTHAIPMLWRLGTSTAMSSRLTCCNLIPVIYNKLPFYLQLQLRGLLNRLLGDSEDVIRIQVLECICTRLGSRADMQWVLYCITVAASDTSAIVRGAVFELCVLALENISDAQAVAARNASVNASPDPEGSLCKVDTDMHLVFCRLHPIINKLTEDSESSVKALVAAKCDLLCKYMGLHWSTVILDILLAMLQDPDDHVRTTAVAAAPRLVLNMVNLFNKKHYHLAVQNSPLGRRNKSPVPIPIGSGLSRRVNVAWGAEPDSIGNSSAMTETEATTETVVVTEEVTPLTRETVALLNRIRDNVLPPMLRLRCDACQDVRIALASAIPEMLSAVCKVQVEDTRQGGVMHMGTASSRNSKISVAKVLVAVILELLSDNDTEHEMEIPYAVLQQVLASDLSNISAFIFTASNCNLLISCVSPLALNKNWRMRKAVCSAVPLIVSACKTVETRAQTAAMIIPLLKDDIFEVRRCAASAMCLAASCDMDVVRSASSAINLNTVGGSGADLRASLAVSSRLSMATIMSITGQKRSGLIGAGSSVSPGIDCVLSDSGDDTGSDTVFFEEDMGRMWLDSVVLPNLEDFCTSPKFQERMLALHMVTVLLIEGIVDVSDSRWELLLRMNLSMISDRIVNVRIGVTTVLLSLFPVFVARKEFEDECHKGEGEQSCTTIIPGQSAYTDSSASAPAATCTTTMYPWLEDIRDAVKLATTDKDRDVADLGNKFMARAVVLFD